MDPDDMEDFQRATKAKMSYLHNVVAYAAHEWDVVPMMTTPVVAMFLCQCCDEGISVPNAAGLFFEKFVKKVEQ